MSLSLSVKVTLWSLLLLALAAYSSSSFSLPLGDYFAAALDYDQEFRRVKEEKAIDIYTEDTGYLEYLPEADLSYDYSYTEANDSGEVSAYSSQGDYKRRSLSGRVVQPIYDKSKIEIISAQKSKQSLYGAEIESAKTHLLDRVFSAYQQHYLASISLRNSEEILGLERARLARIEDGASLGVSNDLEYIEAEIQFSQAVADVERYASELQEAESLLEMYTGYTRLTAGVECEGAPSFLAPVELNDMLLMVDQYPSIELLQRELEVLDSEAARAKSRFFPTVYLSYERSRSETINGSFDGSISNTSVAQLGVDIPLFASYSSYRQVSSYSRRSALYSQLLRQTRLNSIKTIRSLYSRYKRMEASFDATNEAYVRSSDLLTIRQQEYELGQISTAELDNYIQQNLQVARKRGEVCMALLGIRVDISIETGNFSYLLME
ncbi:TolC family protein [uncultured Thalassolituus sp.]|uniref:TolC family protein n=1 Tax=uncultured Thalassolituus sp. TaxID=285273 RepID=UPI002623BA6E|nr:TolC family protein [uncultured Thalassolituus sp.]